ncbi:sulfurtransferase complex subunit TusC [Buchnera aphidicola (Aphis helianthi)]|uniref:Sulfurtransferase complex subunit TusC n=1 Tax=Buchnera aphidicola (Aphis helianthi) TaxID=2315802 RepID=A0A4D6XPE3_9GAMM|nr:sulfurtransferase complex subunit TusC [Buchnera aphidicola]QCI17329.1 sulfurtransferase complex subunit TusC [Buchnera aphidicola (Aphis helianthi)]
MKKIAFVFSSCPHGTTFGKEGLDAVLGTSAILKKISLFFIGDGVFQLFKTHKSEKILTRNYTSLFSILSLYDIKNFYCCKLSLFERGLNFNTKFVLQVNILNSYFLRLKLDDHDVIINF